DTGPQVLDTRVIQYVGTDLAAPADISLVIFHGLLVGVALEHFLLVHPRPQHLVCLFTVLVLGAFALTLHNNARGYVGDPDRGVCLVNVLTTGAAGAIRVNTEVGGVDRSEERRGGT